MYTKTITFTDFNGNAESKTYRFHLNKAEITEIELSTKGGLENTIKKMTETQDGKTLVELLKTLITKSIGELSPDGKRFIKNQEIVDEFMSSEAYSEFFMEMVTNEKAASDFVNGILPADLLEKAKELQAKNGQVSADTTPLL